MNFWDLCVACARAIARGCAALWQVVSRMLRLSYRYWWIVCTMVVLAVAAALYYTRPANISYRMNAIALLNGPSIQQFEDAYAVVRSGQLIPQQTPLAHYVKEQHATAFTSFRVVDCLHDGVADYVDFKRKSSPTDTTKVQMQDRLCLQFCIKTCDLHLLPEIEQALLEFLNADAAMQQAYAAYLPNLKNRVAFNHSQWNKLDSLTSSYYFQTRLGERSATENGMVFMGDQKVHLFLDKIYEQQSYTELTDQRLQLATAPVVLENHFAVDSKPVNGRNKMLVIFFLLGWIGGCVIAEAVDRRKAIAEWLKKE